MLLVTYFANTKWRKIAVNPGMWYSSESTQWELSNEYQHDKVYKNLYIIVLWRKVASALEWLSEQ